MDPSPCRKPRPRAHSHPASTYRYTSSPLFRLTFSLVLFSVSSFSFLSHFRSTYPSPPLLFYLPFSFIALSILFAHSLYSHFWHMLPTFSLHLSSTFSLYFSHSPFPFALSFTTFSLPPPPSFPSFPSPSPYTCSHIFISFSYYVHNLILSFSKYFSLQLFHSPT